ncbi:MAG: hypothetical protein ACE5JE_02895 [Thermoplasmata archaeon]
MSEVRLTEKQQHTAQRVSLIHVEGEIASLVGPSLEIRFPARWARKLLPWYRGTGRTILCNADVSRFNLVGATKVADHLILSYMGADGELAAESVKGDFIKALDGLLRARS